MGRRPRFSRYSPYDPEASLSFFMVFDQQSSINGICNLKFFITETRTLTPLAQTQLYMNLEGKKLL
jgi:hypothetical protein